jgi:hypothetical protein
MRWQLQGRFQVTGHNSSYVVLVISRNDFSVCIHLKEVKMAEKAKHCQGDPRLLSSEVKPSSDKMESYTSS